jgi:hypothetical protein
MRKTLFALAMALTLVLSIGCCKKYEMALADLDASVIVVQKSLTQAMDIADEAVCDEGPLYDKKDRDAKMRTCYEMRALIYTTLLGEKVEYDMATGDLFYMKGEEKVAVPGGEKEEPKEPEGGQ